MTMRRGIVGLLCALAAMAQPPQQTPLDRALQAYWEARNAGRFADAIRHRDEARGLLAQVPPEAPQFAAWVQQVSQLYESAQMTARAREVLESALARTSRLGDAHPTRTLLLDMLSNDWQQDGNLLKAAACLEQEAAALEAAPPEDSISSSGVAHRQIAFSGAVFVRLGGNVRGPNARIGTVYHRLAAIYQQMGRPEAVAGVLAKVKRLDGDNSSLLASFYEGAGRLDEAADVYRKQSAQATGDPQQAAGSLQLLAMLYQREQRYGDATAALQQAISVVNSAGAAGRSQSIMLREGLAGVLQQAGQTG